MRRGFNRRDNEAVASAIGTMLAILVLLALLTMVTTSWAPEWTKSKESEHLRVVEGQFANMKALMDQLGLSDNTDTVVSTPITLGSEGVPLFSSDSSGTISLLSPYNNNYNTFAVSNSTGRYVRVAYGSMAYESHNNEYVDQKFIYESGAIIIQQIDGEVLVTGPGFVIQNLTSGIKVSVTLVSIYSDGQEYTGVGTVAVNCRLVQEKILTTKTWSPTETIYINLTSTVYEAWYDYFQVAIPGQGVASGDYDISVDPSQSCVNITIRNVNQLVTDYVILGTTLNIS